MGKSVNFEQPNIKLYAIESVLTAGKSEGVFQIRYSFVEAVILWDMVRSTVINADAMLSIDEMADVIMRVFTDGIRQLQCSHS